MGFDTNASDIFTDEQKCRRRMMRQIEEIDSAVSAWAQGAHSELGDRYFGLISKLGDHPVLVCAGLLGAELLLRLRGCRSALIFGLAGLLGLIISTNTKELVQRPRPHWGYGLELHNYSFPSGHALGSMVVYGTLVLMLTRSRSNPTGPTPLPGAVTRTAQTRLAWLDRGQVGLLLLGIGVSRVYLGAHYPSDVLGGWAAGLGLALLATWLDAKWNPGRLP
jgi:undecaprenyl-diphosphatase